MAALDLPGEISYGGGWVEMAGTRLLLSCDKENKARGRTAYAP
jgi:hypothetical protein